MSHFRLYLLLVAVMFAWGMNLPALKYLTAQMGPITMTSLRIFIAGITVFIILYFAKLIRMPTRKEWMYIFGGSMLNVVIHHYFISVGLTMTSGTNAGLILGTGPIMTAVFGLLLLRLKPTLLQWTGFVLGLFGVSATVVVGSSGVSSVSLGDIYIFLSILGQVLSFLLISKAAATLDPRLLTGYMFIIGSAGLFLIGLYQEPAEWQVFREMDATFWILIICSGMIATAIGHMMYNYSVGKVGPAKAAIFINLNTLFGILGSAFFLGEILTVFHLIGLVFVVAGVILGSGAAEDLWKKRKLERN
ncbi:DMT family transporter [Planococcus sp. CAU13]|uniref:DMT family transporter n=1 Tax=Planococcus sp. CAU13 TaxID=1541197 RepID=UPI0005300594|nr:DMT family transporter [Planococcus sp. CAU13]